jgi:hypothetical protein
MQEQEVFLTSRQVRERYGNVSEMWLIRRERDKASGFPDPLRIRGRKFWKLSDLLRFEESLEAA